jgi:hypothetical protein
MACQTLVLNKPKALHVASSAPWILAYRPERSKRVLASLAVTLGMSREELSHCVGTYPRMLSLSVDKKIRSVLRKLTQAAASIYARSVRDSGEADWSSAGGLRRCFDAKALAAAAEGEVALAKDLEASMAQQLDAVPGVSVYRQSDFDEGLSVVYARRRNTVRSMVRSAVLRYPLILGTSLDRIEERLDKVISGSVDISWPQVVTYLRRDEAAHARWATKTLKEGEEGEEE